jgi:hypothetical protein
MDIERAVERVANYMSSNFGMFPNTAKMVARFHITNYLKENNKEELVFEDIPDLGRWLAGKFIKAGIISSERVQKMIADFESRQI